METRYSSLHIDLPKPSPSLSSSGDDDLPLIGNPTPKPIPPAGSSTPAAVFNLATSVVGAGIMALPAAMKVLGVFLGLISILAMGALSQLSIELLTRFAARGGAATYGAAVRSTLGGGARAAAELSVVVNTAGILTVYLIIIGDVLSGSPDHSGVLYQLLGRGIWEDRRLVILLVLVLFLAPLCSLERIDSLSVSSAASFALAILFVVIAAPMAAFRFLRGEVPDVRFFPDLASEARILDLMAVVPIMTNAFICHFNVPPIYSELQSPSPEKMNRVSRITTVLCVSVYVCTAVSGYLLFGEETEYDVLINFDRDLGFRFGSALNDLVRIGYVLHLILVFPVVHFSLRETVGTLIFSAKSPPATWKRLALTAALLAAIYFGSVKIPNIGDAFRFTGATTGLALGFVFPAAMAVKVRDPEKKMVAKWERKAAWGMIWMAAVAGGVGIVGNIYRIVKDVKD